MFGPEYFIVGAYKVCGDCPTCGQPSSDQWYGDLFCRECGEREGLPTSLSMSLAEIDDWNDEGHGLYCDKCSAEISPPGCHECGREADEDADAPGAVTLHEDEYGRNVCNRCDPQGCQDCDCADPTALANLSADCDCNCHLEQVIVNPEPNHPYTGRA